MKFTFFSIAVLMAFILPSCADKPEASQDEYLKKAFEAHEDAIKIRKDVQKDLDSLIALLPDHKYAISTGKLDSIRKELEIWDSEFIEVPGYEHEHNHDHEHNDDHHHEHGHEHLSSLTPKQHFEAQSHLLNEIKKIKNRLEKVFENQ